MASSTSVRTSARPARIALISGLPGTNSPQVVTVRAGTFRPHYDEVSAPDPATDQIIRGLMRWTHARGAREKLRGLWQMVGGIRKKK